MADVLCKGTGAVNITLDESTGGRLCPVCYDNVNASGPVSPHISPSGLRFRCVICFQGSFAFGKETVCSTHNGKHHMLPYPFQCVMCNGSVRTKEVGRKGLCEAVYGGVHILPIGGVVEAVVSSGKDSYKYLTHKQLIAKSKCQGCGKKLGRGKWGAGTSKCLDCMIGELHG